MPIQTPKCNKCNSEMKLREKDDSKFWGCPNWKNCGGKTQKYQGSDTPSTSQDSKNPPGEGIGFKILAEEVMALRDELKPLIAFMKNELLDPE